MYRDQPSVRRLVFGLLALLSLPALTGSQTQSNTSENQFHWLTQAKDKIIWDRVYSILNDMNSPERPSVGSDIYRIGIQRESAIVLVGERQESGPNAPINYQAFSVDLERKKTESIKNPGQGGIWQWKLVRLARFSEQSNPDIVFRFHDCVDCESVELLASFEYDSRKSAWRFRQWNPREKAESGSFLLIGADTDTGETNDGTSILIKTTCVYKVGDLGGDGVDEVGSWCRVMEIQMDAPGRQVSSKDTTQLFSGRTGTSQLSEIEEPAFANELHKKICSGQEAKPLCRSLAKTNASNSPAK